jgi:hypothetical protein
VQNGVVEGAHERDAVVAPPPNEVIAHTNLYWTYQTAPGRTAGAVETKTSTSAARPEACATGRERLGTAPGQVAG